MNGTPEAIRSRHEPGASWTSGEAATLFDAVRKAPSVHNTQPWTLALREHVAILSEQRDLALPEHDPEGRDRRISCGAGLANLVVAVSVLGWAADVSVSLADETVTATVLASRRAEPTEIDDRRYRAITDRRTHRSAFGPQAVPDHHRDAVRSATSSPDVVSEWISGPYNALAVGRLLDYAARVYQRDIGYQRELSKWVVPAGAADLAGRGLSPGAFAQQGLAAAGLSTSRTRVPDAFQLASRIEQEAVLVLGTRFDQPHDHVRVGEAAERAWLEATSRGIAASIMTQPLHLAEVREGLADRLELSVQPQALMRFGYPA